jgi:hypothetical protein
MRAFMHACRMHAFTHASLHQHYEVAVYQQEADQALLVARTVFQGKILMAFTSKTECLQKTYPQDHTVYTVDDEDELNVSAH